MATSSAKDKFEAAVRVIRSLPSDGPFQPSNEMKLKFYAFFKQANEGPCKQSKPSFWDVINKAKWDAWTKLGDMDKETAMNSYVEELKQILIKNIGPDKKKIVETMPQTTRVAEFVDKLGSFYEVVDENAPPTQPALANGDAAKANGKNPLVNGGANGLEDSGEEKEEVLSNGHGSVAGGSEGEVMVRHLIHTGGRVLKRASGRTPQSTPGNSPRDPPEIPDSRLPLSDRTNGRSSGGRAGARKLRSESGDDTDTDEFCDTSDQMAPSDESSSAPVVPSLDLRLDEYDGPAFLALSEGPGPLEYPLGRGGGSVGGDAPDSGRAPHRLGSSGSLRAAGLLGGVGEYDLPQNMMPLHAAGGAGGYRPPSRQGENERYRVTSEAVAVAVLRLQQDMSVVLRRLQTLEQRALQDETDLRERKRRDTEVEGESWWRAILGLPGRSLAFVLVWPFAVQLLLWALTRRRRLRR